MKHAVDDDVLDVMECAALLRVGRNHVYALTSQNAIPHRRVGKLLRFSRAALMRWLADGQARPANG